MQPGKRVSIDFGTLAQTRHQQHPMQQIYLTRKLASPRCSRTHLFFFAIDSRVLLEPVDRIRAAADSVSGDFLNDFVGTGTRNLPEDRLPNVFYSFAHRGFLDADQFVCGLVFVKRDKGSTFIRRYDPREAMDAPGLTINCVNFVILFYNGKKAPSPSFRDITQ